MEAIDRNYSDRSFKRGINSDKRVPRKQKKEFKKHGKSLEISLKRIAHVSFQASINIMPMIGGIRKLQGEVFALNDNPELERALNVLGIDTED